MVDPSMVIAQKRWIVITLLLEMSTAEPTDKFSHSSGGLFAEYASVIVEHASVVVLFYCKVTYLIPLTLLEEAQGTGGTVDLLL